MENKYLAIIILAIVAVAGCASYFMFFSGPQYKNITMNGITMEVPESDINVTQQTDIFSLYNDTENHVDVFVFDSADMGFSDLSEAMEFAALREMFQVGSTLQSSDGYSYNYSESTGVYTYVSNYTHKNYLVVTADKDVLIHILKSMDVEEEVTINETTESKTVKKVNKAPVENNSSDISDDYYDDYNYERDEYESDYEYEEQYSDYQ